MNGRIILAFVTVYAIYHLPERLNAHLVLRALNMFVKGAPPLLPNDASRATYNTFPTRDDVKKFKAKGFRLL